MPSKPRSQSAPDQPPEVEAAATPPEVEAVRRRDAARRAAAVDDSDLDGLADLELLDEARRRGVTFTRAVTRAEIIAAAKAATA